MGNRYARAEETMGGYVNVAKLCFKCRTSIWKAQVWIPVLHGSLLGDFGVATRSQHNITYRGFAKIKYRRY